MNYEIRDVVDGFVLQRKFPGVETSWKKTYSGKFHVMHGHKGPWIKLNLVPPFIKKAFLEHLEKEINNVYELIDVGFLKEATELAKHLDQKVGNGPPQEVQMIKSMWDKLESHKESG